MSNVTTLLQRPMPPESLASLESATAPDTFLPAPELVEWIQTAYLAEDGPLYCAGHAHLNDARIGCLWTNASNSRGGKMIIGQAEMPERLKAGKWQVARQLQQFREWFGVVPDFLITFDALFAADADDRTWCCLVEHELQHCAQAEDEFGMPRFNKQTGEPIFTLKTHDLEAFVADVARYGPDAAGDDAVNFIIAAAHGGQRLSDTQIAIACGRKVQSKEKVA